MVRNNNVVCKCEPVSPNKDKQVRDVTHKRCKIVKLVKDQIRDARLVMRKDSYTSSYRQKSFFERFKFRRRFQTPNLCSLLLWILLAIFLLCLLLYMGAYIGAAKCGTGNAYERHVY